MAFDERMEQVRRCLHRRRLPADPDSRTPLITQSSMAPRRLPLALGAGKGTIAMVNTFDGLVAVPGHETQRVTTAGMEGAECPLLGAERTYRQYGPDFRF